MFSLKLFGVVSLADADGPLAGPTVQRRRLALLALIAASPGGTVSRERLIGCLWPDAESEAARRFVADSVYILRKALGADAIRASADVLHLEPAVVYCDVLEFRRAIADGDWMTAVALYNGPFLDGFSLPDAVEFEQWADAVRAELARTCADALEHLARAAASRGDHAGAAAWWQRLQAMDPLNSRVALELMTALAASGDRAAALRHARVHDTLLREEIGIAAGAAILEFARDLRSEAMAPPSEPRTVGGDVGGSPPPRQEWAEDSPSPPDGSTPEGTGPSAPADPGLAGTAVHETSRPRPRRSLRQRLAAAVLVAPVAVGALAVLRPEPPDRRRVLVALFENRTGDAANDPVGRMAADWVARSLIETGRLDVISPTWTIYEYDESHGPRSAAQRAGAGTLIQGAVYGEGGRLRLEAQVLDPVRGSLLHAIESLDVPADSGMAAIERLGERVATAVVARFGGPRDQREITARAHPPPYDAYLDYVEGVRLFSQFRMEQAAQRLDRAWALDSSFHLAGLYRTLAAANVGDEALADSLIRTLADRRGDMAAFDRSLLEALQADRAGDPARLLRAMREVAAYAPGSQFVVGLAVAAIHANRPYEALRTLERLAPDAALVEDNPRYLDWLTTALHMTGDHRAELRQARRVRARQTGMTATLVPEIRALAALGRIEELERLLDEGRLLPAVPGGRPPDLLEAAAAELRAHGHPVAAARAIAKAAEWYDAIAPGDMDRSARARVLYAAGRWDEAQLLYEQLAAARPADIGYLGRLGTIAARRGDRSAAQRIASDLAALAPPRTRSGFLWRARIAALLGEHEQAVGLLGEALRTGAAHGMAIHTDPDLEPLRELPAFQRLVRAEG